jgi:CheY-specific phosphatase CheX
MPLEVEQRYALDGEPGAGDTAGRVVAEVLETMFFTEAEMAGCEHGWLAAASCARIRFEGSHRGEMLLGVSAEAVDPIAASFLGLDPMELTDGQRGQVIQELSNILCGAMLSRLWPESTLALSSPELTAWQDWTSQRLTGDGLHRCFAIPEGMLAISICLTPLAPAGTAPASPPAAG